MLIQRIQQPIDLSQKLCVYFVAFHDIVIYLLKVENF